jgi:glycosyltransferase involved in cell wall biosynthesis
MNSLDEVQAMIDAELRDSAGPGVDTGAGRPAAQDVLLSVVIPVYNERKTIARVLGRVAALPLKKEIVIVDDCSTDGTRELLGKLDGIPGIRLVLKPENEGKGAALRTGFEQATGDIVVIQDADLEYNPCEIPRLLEPILRGEAEIVYGSRFLGEEIHDKSWIHRFGNGLLTKMSNWFSGLALTDMETCYKAFRRDVLGCLQVAQNRFGIEPELTAKLARRGYRFAEVPISYNPRGYAEGKKIGVRDLLKAFYCIGRYGIAD